MVSGGFAEKLLRGAAFKPEVPIQGHNMVKLVQIIGNSGGNLHGH